MYFFCLIEDMATWHTKAHRRLLILFGACVVPRISLAALYVVPVSIMDKARPKCSCHKKQQNGVSNSLYTNTSTVCFIPAMCHTTVPLHIIYISKYIFSTICYVPQLVCHKLHQKQRNKLILCD